MHKAKRQKSRPIKIKKVEPIIKTKTTLGPSKENKKIFTLNNQEIEIKAEK